MVEDLWLQKKTQLTCLHIVSDAALKHKGDSGHGLRGALFAPGPAVTDAGDKKSAPVHVLHWARKGPRHVARNTLARKLLTAGDAVDYSLLLAQQLNKMLAGPTSSSDACQQRMLGGFLIPLMLLVDDMSSFTADTATLVQESI